MSESTIKYQYNKPRILLMFSGVIFVLLVVAYLWRFQNEPYMVFRKGVIVIIWIISIYSVINMIFGFFSQKPPIAIDSNGFYASRLIGGIGWVDWCCIDKIVLRNNKIKVILNERELSKIKCSLLDKLLLSVCQNKIYIRNAFLLDVSMSDLHRKIDTYYQNHCSKGGNRIKIGSDDLEGGKTIIYGYYTLGKIFSPLFFVGKSMFKYKDRLYRFDDIERIDKKGYPLLRFTYSFPSAKIVLKDGKQIKLIGNLERKDYSNEFFVSSEGTEAYYELLEYLESKL